MVEFNFIAPGSAGFVDNEQVLPPSFFVVGAQKAGTTALHHYLARHPDIFLPAIKETHFFDDGHGEYRLGIDHYIEKYFHVDAHYLISGEVDPEYLFFPEVASRIASYCPNAKLIFVFRDPVARAYSHYQMSFSRGLDQLDFAQAIAREDARMALFPELVDPDAERVTYRPSERTRRIVADYSTTWCALTSAM
ncbi:MAG: sulfotransferase [Gammaproteobacteria bacterium]|nr:sulfotransferase [Gammaproteobacteria bacterium]